MKIVSSTKKAGRKQAFTLVEIMISILILLILTMGGAAVLYQSGGGIQIHGNERVALELVNSVLEEQQMQGRDLARYIEMTSFTTNHSVDGVNYPMSVAVTNMPTDVDVDVIAHKQVTVSAVLRGQTIQASADVIPAVGIQEE